jgi:selenocysteine lyase/cysteine desulfurase
VKAALDAYHQECLEQGDLGFGKWMTAREAVRARVARFVGAQPNEVAFTSSTSSGFTAAAELLWSRGVREVLTFDGEFPSTTVPFLARGHAVRVVRRRPDGSVALSDVEAALRPTTGAIVASVVQFSSGFRVDLEGLSRLAKSRGLPLGLNAAQALGQTKVDFAGLGAAFLSATSHKWLFAGYGTGLFVAKQEWLETPLPVAGWLSVEPARLWKTLPTDDVASDAHGLVAKGVAERKDAAKLELGAGSLAGLLGLQAALDVHEALGLDVTVAQLQRLQARLRAGLRQRGFVPNAPDEAATVSGICGVTVAGTPEDAVKALLKDAGVVATARAGVVRLSTHVYNDESDVDATLAAFDRLGLRPG